MAVKLVKKNKTATPSQQGAASAASSEKKKVRLVSTGKPVSALQAPYSTQKTQTSASTSTPKYDISGDAWTRATASQTVIPSKTTSTSGRTIGGFSGKSSVEDGSPVYNRRTAERLAESFTNAESALTNKRDSGIDIVTEVEQRSKDIETQVSNLKALEEMFNKDKSEANAQKYNSAYEKYAKDVEAYNNLYNEYKALYDTYSAAYDNYTNYMDTAKSDATWGDNAKDAFWSGIAGIDKAFTSTLALPERALQPIIQTIMPGVSTPLSDLADYYSDIYEDVANRRADNLYGKGKIAELASDAGMATIQALPNAILALMSSGTSIAGQGAAALGTATNTGLASTISNGIQTMAKNPMYWSSFIQTVGNDYDENIENGSSNLEALASALISSALNAGVEIGGGIETLPDAVKNGGNSAVKEWVKSMLDEGKEEVIQDIISGITQKAVYDQDKTWFSATDEDAVVNPGVLAKDFGMGAAVGGILGGGQAAAVNVQNRINDRRLGKIGSDYSEVAQELIDEGLTFDKNTEAYQTAEELKARLDAGEELPDKDLGRAVIANQRAIELEKINEPELYAQTNTQNTSYEDTGSVLDSLFASDDELPSADKMRSSALEMANKTLGKEGKRVFAMAYRDDGNPSVTYGALTRAYNDGLVNRKGTAENITQAQYDAMFQAGRADATASMKAQAKAASSVPVYGGKSGLDFDDADTKSYVEQHVDQNTAKAIDAVSKLLGIKVRFADSVAGGIANADIENGIVTIEKGNPNPLRFLFGHEITHRMQELAPKEYAHLRKAIMEYAPMNEHAEFQQRVYLKNNKTLGNEEAIDEATADYVGRILTDDGELERFIRKAQGDQTLLEKLRDFVHDLAVKLSGTEYEKQILAAEKRLTKALRAAAKQADANTKAQKNTAQDGGVNRFSSKMDVLALDGVDWMDNYSSIKEQLRKHAVEINDMEPVAVVDYTPKSSTHLVLDIMDEVAKIGGKNMKNGVVSFAFDETGAKTIYSHAKSNELRAAALSAPYVAKYGKLIAGQKNHENSGLTTLTYAAPVIINETTVNVGVAIQFQANGRPRAVNVGLQSGDVFKLDMKKAPKGPRSRVVRYGQGTSLLTKDAFNDNVAQKESFVNTGISYDSESESVSPSGKLSMKTWNASDYVQERKKAAGEMASILGISQKKAMDYIDSVNSIAKMIADDRVRLDYEASPGRSSFIGNVEYGGSIDFSTICKKRRLFTGTFEAIQNALPNTALTAEEILEIRSMMDKKGYEVSCGLCYVEGSRANMGQYAKQFLEQYAKTNPAYLPNMAEINTPNGLEKLRIQHPEVYAAYESFMNKLAQRKPKLYQLSTEYQGEILNKFRKKNGQVKADDVASKNANGGIRLQSFSDFEIIHLIDSMQVIMDMSRVGLNGQAYTKVPDFAWALGDTGLKINLSLIAKGVDRNGRLILDEKEGMSEKDAMALRNRYSKNVGTVIVVFTDRQLKAAMADDRIDYIIPFHRSQWNKGQYEAMGLPANAKDFTSWQNEAYIEPVYNSKGKKQRPDNYMPNTYWDFSKSGKENAEAYLKMCAENNRRPKFHYLLVDNQDGSYSLQPDGSTDGYWKTLIDFKMYDNDGKGYPQMPVRPDFNMDQAKRMLDEYTGGHNAFPAAQDVVDEFVSKYKDSHKGAKFSMKDQQDQAYMNAVNSGELGRAQSMVDHKAMISGYNIKLHHGTAGEPFYVFRQGAEGIHFGTIAQATKRAEVAESRYGYRTNKYTTGDIRKNPGKYPDSARRSILDYIVSVLPIDFTQEEMDAAYDLIYNDGHVSDEMLLRYIDRVEQDYRETTFSLNNQEMGKDPVKRVISAYVKAQHPMTFDVDIGEWIPPKLAGILIDKIEGNTTEIFSSAEDGWVTYDPKNIQGIDLTEEDLYALRRLQESMDFEDMARFLQSKGVDSIRYLNTYEGTRDEESYILLSPEQVKSAEPVTYDDNGNVIPLSQRFDYSNNDIRFSLKGSEQLVFEIDRILREGKAQKRSDADIQADIRKAVEEVYQGMLQDYGAIKKGENPARDVQVPEQTAKDKKVSQTVRTILEAKATPDTLLPKIEELVATGEFSYDVYTDKAAIEDANNTINHVGWAQALVDWTDSMRKGEVSKKNTAMGWALYNNAVNRGDVKTALSVLDHMVRHQRNAAQAVQATRILKQLSPETQLYQVQRSVESLQEELNKRFRGKNAPELKISQELAERYMKAKDQQERDEIMKDIYRDIGRQMPSTFRDKWNAWRYLAMLGNVRTHIRNIIGNAGFAPAVIAKDITATAIESAVSRVSGGKLNRSKGMVGFSKADRALLSAAWSDFDNVQDMALGGGKYSEFQNANKYIEEGRQVFKFKPLEAARKGNSKALDKEDMWFSRPHYAYAMAQYCKAHNITAEQIARGKAIKPARVYSIREAQKATYRDSNALSDAVSTFGKVRDQSNPVKKGAGIVAEGVMPFRKTPANILMRGIEYSPVGLLKGIHDAAFSVRNGEKTGAEAIDSIAAGLTGTGLVALGLFMAAEGLVRGSGGDDEKEKEFEELMGHQAYSLEVGGKSVTLDWLAPESMPFFVGVNVWEAMETDGLTFAEALDTVSMITEPLLEMSMLQSLNDVFEKVGNTYNAGIKGLPAAISNAVTSYLTQALPTVLGQAERTGQDVRMTTYTDKNASLNSDMQYALGTASARIPGIDYNQIPYIDAWGRTESTGGTGERAFNNFLNPAYTSNIDTSAMEEELMRLYESTGEAGVLPSRAAKYFTVDGQRKDLTAEEYVQYATLRGQSAYELVTDLVNSQQYKDMSEEERVKAVKEAYDLANQQAKAAISDYAAESWIEKATEAEKKYGISQDTYISLKTQASGIQSLKDKDGETIENSRGLQIMEMIYDTPGLTEKQRQAMFEYLGVGKTIRHYNKSLVKEKLEKMRRQAK